MAEFGQYAALPLKENKFTAENIVKGFEVITGQPHSLSAELCCFFDILVGIAGVIGNLDQNP